MMSTSPPARIVVPMLRYSTCGSRRRTRWHCHPAGNWAAVRATAWHCRRPSTMYCGSSAARQPFDDVLHATFPLLAAQAFQSPQADVVFVSSLAIGQVAQFHRLELAIDDHGRAQAGAQPQEQHLAPLVASESLHRRVVDHLDRATEGGREIEADPALAEIGRLGDRLVGHDRAGVADAHHVVGPAFGQLLDALDHFGGRKRAGGVELAVLGFTRHQNLDVRAADIDDQYALCHVPRLACVVPVRRQCNSLGDVPIVVPQTDDRIVQTVFVANATERGGGEQEVSAGRRFEPQPPCGQALA